MKSKIFLTSIIALAFMCPAMAVDGNATIENGDTCDINNLGTNVNNDTANLEAIWTANTIHIKWYNGNTQVATNDCTYNETITTPTTNPTRVGYTFGGWQIKNAQVQEVVVNVPQSCDEIDNKSECNATNSCGWAVGCLDIEGARCHTLSENECSGYGKTGWYSNIFVGGGFCSWQNNTCEYVSLGGN